MSSIHKLFTYLDLRRLMKLCSISNREVVFLFIDTQIIDTFFLEDINALLHTGEVPNLFRNEDIQEVYLRSIIFFLI
jgi:dynein heavy chain